MFKKLKLLRTEIHENKFKEPKTKKTMELITHTKERTPIEKILYGLKFQSKRKTMFRLILSLKEEEIVKNIYMIANGVLVTLIENISIDKLLFSVLSKLLATKNKNAIKTLIFNYLKAQLSIDKNYTDFLKFLIRNFREVIIENKEEILKYVTEPALIRTISNMKQSNKPQLYDYNQPICIIFE